MTGVFSRPLLRKIGSNRATVFLALLWLITVATAILSRISGLNAVEIVVGLAGFSYILVLIWTLASEKPSPPDLAASDFILTPPISFAVAFFLVLLFSGLVFLVGIASGVGFSAILVASITSLGLIIWWRSRITWNIAAWGCLVGLLAGLGITYLGNGDATWAIFNLVALPPIFVGGALLIKRTHLARFQVLRREYLPALRGFLWGCILGIPPALFNLLGNPQAGDTWIKHWWQPLYAFVPGIAEETWARLFLTTFCYALLSPASKNHPRWAIWIAILVSALLHGFGHTGINPIGLVIGSLLYGIPAGLLLIKKDFEHVVGYHFIVDFVRFSAALFRV